MNAALDCFPRLRRCRNDGLWAPEAEAEWRLGADATGSGGGRQDVNRGHDELDALAERLMRAWSAETSSSWTAEAPARGQCSVTAIAVQRLHGGELLKTSTPGGLHYYNRIGGRRYDFTAGQFPRPIAYEDLPSGAAEAMTDTSPAQVDALLRRLGAET